MLYKKNYVAIMLACSVFTSYEAVAADNLIVSKNNIGAAFTGGGWHAHAGHAGWLAGAMESTNQDLSHLMSNVDALASNSGGSWFLSMLAFSDDFVKSLETAKGRDNYAKTGYLGKSHHMFEGAIKEGFDSTCTSLGSIISNAAEDFCRKTEGKAYLGILDKFDQGKTGERHLGWGDLVRTAVYEPVGNHLDDGSKLGGVTLQHPHLPWARKKSLVFASTALTEDVVVSADGDQFYDQSAGLPKVQYSMSFDKNKVPQQQHFTPVFFTSLDKSAHKATPVFSAGNPVLTYWQGDGTDKTKFSINANVSLEGVKVVDAAISSSSAAGMAASKKLLGLATSITSSRLLGEGSWLLAGLATPVNLTGDTMAFRNGGYVVGKKKWRGYELLKVAKKKKTIRLADGGYFDNTGVSYLVRHMQANNLADNFNIVSFLNNTTPADCCT